MENVLLVVYLLIVLALIGVILVQRSEGGGLGMGGNAGGLMTVRGSANLLTRTTAVLAALFFATAIGLTILTELNRGTDTIVDKAANAPVGTTLPATAAEAASGASSAPGTVLDQLLQQQGDAPAGTSSQAAPAQTSTDPGLAIPMDMLTPADTASSAPPDAGAASSASAPPASSAAQ